MLPALVTLGITLLTKAVPAFGTAYLEHLEKKMDSASEADRKDLEWRKTMVGAQVQLNAQREQTFMGRLPVFIISMSVAIYIAAVFIDSAFPMEWLTPLALPKPKSPDDLSVNWTYILMTVVASMFVAGTVERTYGKR